MATIRVDCERTIGEVDRRIFGGFIEHLGRCIYGGVFDESSPLSDERGFRQDVLDAARALRIPVLRWPGGNFASGYHWTDGIGPVDDRPARHNLAWHSIEPNRFGTDEFVAYCAELGAEPYICLNMGTGTMDEACSWLEYCNGTGETYWSQLRRDHGHQEPYGVPYWGLGNEMYGDWQIGALSADDYVKRAREWAKVLRWTDPSIKLVSCGENGLTDWDRVVIEGLAPFVDYHSIHIYTGADDYWHNVLSPLQAERALHRCRTLIDHARYVNRIEHPIKVAYDEWNVWFRETAAGGRLEERYTLADALAVGTYLNVFVRNCETVKIANLAQMVNVIAPMMTSEDGLLIQSIYHPLLLSARYTQEVALDPLVLCDEVEHRDDEPQGMGSHRVGDLGPFPVLDVAATRDEDSRRLVLAVVNRDPSVATPVEVEVEGGRRAGGEIAVHEVNGDDPEAVCSFERPDAVAVSRRAGSVDDGVIRLDLGPHSFSLIEVPLGA